MVFEDLSKSKTGSMMTARLVTESATMYYQVPVVRSKTEWIIGSVWDCMVIVWLSKRDAV